MNWSVYGWVRGHQAVKQMITLSWGAPAGLGLGGHLPQSKTPAHYTQSAGQHVNVHLPQGRVLDQLGCHQRGSNYLI